MKSFVALLIALGAASLQAQTWSLDQAHSSVAFSTRHLLVSTTRGEFDSLSITVSGDAAKPTTLSVQVTIPTANLDTRSEKRDEHLRSPDFFDVAKFPAITFQSTKIVKRGKQLVMLGKLTMRDVTKDIEIPFTLSGPIADPWKNTRIGMEGSFKLNRKDFGVGGNIPEAVVSEEVLVEISYEGILQK